jgi:hypothetical protein
MVAMTPRCLRQVRHPNSNNGVIIIDRKGRKGSFYWLGIILAEGDIPSPPTKKYQIMSPLKIKWNQIPTVVK